MAGILLSGPAGANKSAEARRLLRGTSGACRRRRFSKHCTSALTWGSNSVIRSGRYPLRDERLLPIVLNTFVEPCSVLPRIVANRRHSH